MTTETAIEIIASPEDANARLDKLVNQHLPDITRSRIQGLIKDGNLSIGHKVITQCAYRLKGHEQITLQIPPTKPSIIEAVDLPLDIVFEDDDLLVINKAAGMTVHPGAGTKDDTLVHALLYHCKDSLSGIGGVERPGIVHRLDRDTTGLMVVAKHDDAHHHLSQQLQDRSLTRIYHALVWGELIPAAGTINTAIIRSSHDRTKMTVVPRGKTLKGSKHAITHYQQLSCFHDGVLSLVECQLETGRTHQIRVHMAHMSHPLIGDGAYGKPHAKGLHQLPENTQTMLRTFSRQALHAHKLCFMHPRDESYMEFSSDLPADFHNLIEELQD